MRYEVEETGWDAGGITEPIKAYIDQLENKDLEILIPGAGNAHEAEYLWSSGFKNSFVLDIAKTPLNNFKKRQPNFPSNQLLHQDFFSLNGSFDLIIEQTFFCALDPQLRSNYAQQMHKLLRPNGKLVGLLFDFELTEQGPPFGGSALEYLTYFDNLFTIKTLERSYNSIQPRDNRELFFIFEKR